MISTDLTFLTNEPGKTLGDRFANLLQKDTRFFDCLVGYFFISGFHRLHTSLEDVEKVRILVGLKTDAAVYNLMQQVSQPALDLKSHAVTKVEATKELLEELEMSPDTAAIEVGVDKFLAWLRSGKLEVKAYPSENLHAKVYIMTFREGDRDKGRVITGSSNLTQPGLQENLEFNVELKNVSDYDFAMMKFNELWSVAVDVKKPVEETIVLKSPYAHFTPSPVAT